MNNSAINILGITFKLRSKEEIIKEIKGLLTSRQKSETVFTPNAEILFKAYRDDTYRKTINSASLLIPDGIGINIAIKALSKKRSERTTGIEIAEYVLGAASKNGQRIFLLGGKDGIAEKAKERLESRYENICITGTHHGYFDKSKNSDENSAIVDIINNSGADILFVCFGAPMQEIWIEQNSDRLLYVKLSMGLGGCLDVWSGNVPRAPKIMRSLGLEWLYRIVRQPKRLRRLPNLVGFLFAVMKQSRISQKKERREN